MVSQPIEFKKRFRGLQTRIIDIFHIIYFPLRFAMTLLFGIPIVYFEKKSNKRMEEKYKNKAGDVTLQVDFFIIDWKNTFSKGITPQRYIDY
jgi:hypothetical protein